MTVDLTQLVTAEALARAAEVETARQLLHATDWMVLRAVETGTPVPTEIGTARAEARRTLGG